MPDAPDSHGLDDLYDIARLADRLGVEHATVRVWLSRKVPWLPPPDGRLNGGAVWRAETLAGLEDRRRPGRPGPKPRHALPLPSVADATIPAQPAATLGNPMTPLPAPANAAGPVPSGSVAAVAPQPNAATPAGADAAQPNPAPLALATPGEPPAARIPTPAEPPGGD